MKSLSRFLGVSLVAIAVWLGAQMTYACPFCAAPSLTMAEQVAQSDATVLVMWASGVKGTDDSAGSTTFEVKQIVRNFKDTVKVGEKITLPRYRAAKAGDLFMLMGTQTEKGKSIEWGSPLEVSEGSFNYISQAPSPEQPVAKRLEYYVKFLENPQELVANDAYGEFANAPYEDITKLGDKLPREKLRVWVTNAETPATRLGLYGLLIGLCGNDEDAKAIEARILQKSDDFRLGIDGLISGYLLLTRAKGLEVIDNAKLRNKNVPFSETYAAMQAIRFMWQYGDSRIEQERLRASMRILLERPELADLVIADLARWKDWSIQEKLMAMYGEGEFNIPSIKRAIVRYMLVSSKDLPKDATAGENATIPKHVEQGRIHVAKLREKDPKTVAEAERFMLPLDK